VAASLRRISLLLLAIMPVTFPAESWSQQPAGSTATLRLTLKEAVQLALKQNPQKNIAHLLVSESDRSSQLALSSLAVELLILARENAKNAEDRVEHDVSMGDIATCGQGH
jgi:hypothetical protein